jgi:hypothetical protein
MDVARQLNAFLVRPRSQHPHGVFEYIAEVEPYVIQLQLTGFDLSSVIRSNPKNARESSWRFVAAVLSA